MTIIEDYREQDSLTHSADRFIKIFDSVRAAVGSALGGTVMDHQDNRNKIGRVGKLTRDLYKTFDQMGLVGLA